MSNATRILPQQPGQPQHIRRDGQKYRIDDDAYAGNARQIKHTLSQIQREVENQPQDGRLAASVANALVKLLKTQTQQDPVSQKPIERVLSGMPNNIDAKARQRISQAFADVFALNAPPLDPDSKLGKLVVTLGKQVAAKASPKEQGLMGVMLNDLMAAYETQDKGKHAVFNKTHFSPAEANQVNQLLGNGKKDAVPLGHYPSHDVLAGVAKLATGKDGKTIEAVKPEQAAKLARDVAQKYSNAHVQGQLTPEKKAELMQGLDTLLKNTPDAHKATILQKLFPLFNWQN
jgi:hypothetical protein